MVDNVDKSLVSPVSLHDRDGHALDVSTLDDRLRVEDLSTADLLANIFMELRKISFMLNVAFDIELEGGGLE